MAHSHTLTHVVNMIGMHAAIRLVRHKGGLPFNLPKEKSLHCMHWLDVEVGMDNAVKLCRKYQGTNLSLPNEVNALTQLRNQAIAEDYKTGNSIAIIAKRYEVDQKLIKSLLEKIVLNNQREAKHEL